MYSFGLRKQALHAAACNIGVHTASFQLCKAARNTFTCQHHVMSKLLTLMQYTAALDSLS